ncbi:MAG: ATP-binding protein [Magnetococcales bacterium]|nr:ATP-binding protein [Magnetococcales bacterium]
MSRHTDLILPQEIVVGKDVLELVSAAMYVDPLTIFREYIQNAADSIDDARVQGIIKEGVHGRVDIVLNVESRSIRIRDNGLGLPAGDFANRLTSIGSSLKRGSKARGFRGVGRLAGLGYCQELVFRSRSEGSDAVQELRWDCKSFKNLLSDHSFNGNLYDLIHRVTSLQELDGTNWPTHFFEVELLKPLRIKSDLLLNREAIASYLSQVAPLPFSPEFNYGMEICERLAEVGNMSEIHVHLNGDETPLYRPYRNQYFFAEGKPDRFTNLEVFTIEGDSGNISGLLWLLHHGYQGAISPSLGIHGLRARKGNIQVGDARIFSEIFPESRFAGWTVGELHVLDEKILPNGRRDDFVFNAPYSNLKHQLTPFGDRIARLCRSRSVERNRLKSFYSASLRTKEKLSTMEQGGLHPDDSESLAHNIRTELQEIKRLSVSPAIGDPAKREMESMIEELSKRLEHAEISDAPSEVLANFQESDKIMIQRMIGLIYECSPNRSAAKGLVDKILARLGSLTEA